MSGLPDVVASGSMPLAVAVAAAAGLISFASPCVLPLVPGYLGYVTGLNGLGLEQQHRGRMVWGAGLFVLGFTAVFVLTTVTFSAATQLLVGYQDLLQRILGVVVVAFGLVFLGLAPGSARTAKPGWRPQVGLAGAPLLGAVFAIGWTPCSGPTLAAVQALSMSAGGGIQRGVVLAVAYSLGLGIPFLLAALAYSRASVALALLRRHQRGLQLFGGSVLVLVGLLMATGLWAELMARTATWVLGFEVAV